MDNYFVNEIERTERELLALKTSIVKSGSVVAMLKKSIGYSIPLALNAAQTSATGYVYFKVTVDNDCMVNVTLNKYIDNLNLVFEAAPLTRVVICKYQKMSDLEYMIILRGIGDSNDINTLRNGGSVTLTGTVTVTATDNFSLGAV